MSASYSFLIHAGIGTGKVLMILRKTRRRSRPSFCSSRSKGRQLFPYARQFLFQPEQDRGGADAGAGHDQQIDGRVAEAARSRIQNIVLGLAPSQTVQRRGDVGGKPLVVLCRLDDLLRQPMVLFDEALDVQAVELFFACSSFLNQSTSSGPAGTEASRSCSCISGTNRGERSKAVSQEAAGSVRISRRRAESLVIDMPGAPACPQVQRERPLMGTRFRGLRTVLRS